MFVTLSDFEFPVPAELAEPGSKCWRAIELSLNTPWFVATFCSTDQNLSLRRTMLVAWDSDLVNIVKSTVGGYLEALLLLAPKDDVAGKEWCAHHIKQIWRGYDPDRGNEAVLIFCTIEGRQIRGHLAEPPFTAVHGQELLVDVGKSPAKDAIEQPTASSTACGRKTGEEGST